MSAFPAGAPGADDWIRAYAQVQRRADAEILALLKQSLKDIQRSIRAIEKFGGRNPSDAVKLEQMQRIKAQMLREQARIFTAEGRIVEARRAEAAARASSLGSAIDEAAFTAAGRGVEGKLLGEALTLGLNQTIETAVVRMTQSQFNLSQRIYRTNVWMDGRVQTKINSALARGLTVRQFAAEAEDWFDPATPGGVRYAALRLARTEINNAYHATSVNQAAEKPWVTGLKWNLSGSHPKADACDDLAHEDKFNLGPGVFPARETPRKPHPQCLCVVVPVLPDEDEFLDNLVGGHYDRYLEEKRVSLGQPGRSGRLDPRAPAPKGAQPGLPGSPGLDANRARREAARARQRAIEAKEAIGETAADVDMIIGRGIGGNPVDAVRDAITGRGTIARAVGNAGIPEDLERSLLSVLQITRDPLKVREVLDARARREGLKVIGRQSGAKTKFDGRLHETFGGAVPAEGTPVQVLRRGYTVTIEGDEIFLFRAKVTTAIDTVSPEVRTALRHVREVNKVSPGETGLKTKVKSILEAQARQTPKSMGRLQSVVAPRADSPAGKKMLADMGSNTGADYSYFEHGQYQIRLSPHWNQDEAMSVAMTDAFGSGRLGAGQWHVPTAQPGIGSTVAHEYGHHLDRLITRGTGSFSQSVADRLFPAMSRALGIRDEPRRLADGSVHFAGFDAWVASHKALLSTKVSRYGAHDGRELMAEIWSEYTTAKPPRAYIREIGKLLQQLAEEAA